MILQKTSTKQKIPLFLPLQKPFRGLEQEMQLEITGY